jgi:hypothetical protein
MTQFDGVELHRKLRVYCAAAIVGRWKALCENTQPKTARL